MRRLSRGKRLCKTFKLTFFETIVSYNNHKSIFSFYEIEQKKMYID